MSRGFQNISKMFFLNMNGSKYGIDMLETGIAIPGPFLI